jgi:hypothetical protein
VKPTIDIKMHQSSRKLSIQLARKSLMLAIALAAMTVVQLSVPNTLSTSIPNSNDDSIFGWDLTYQSIIKDSGFKIFNVSLEGFDSSYRSIAVQLFRDWQGAPIHSAMLLEIPTGPCSTAIEVLWIFRAEDKGYVYSITTMAPSMERLRETKEDFDPAVMSELIAAVASWDQTASGKPASARIFGFMSVYDGRVSKQFAITEADFLTTVSSEPEVLEGGRLTPIFQRISDEIKRHKP